MDNITVKKKKKKKLKGKLIGMSVNISTNLGSTDKQFGRLETFNQGGREEEELRLPKAGTFKMPLSILDSSRPDFLGCNVRIVGSG